MVEISKRSATNNSVYEAFQTGYFRSLALVSALALSYSAYAIHARPLPIQNPQTEIVKAAPTAAKNGEGDVQMLMKNVEYHLTDSIIVNITRLEGKLTPKPDQIVNFDEEQSFGIEVNLGNLSLSTAALTNDLNEYVFAKSDAPLKKLTATIAGNEITVKGLLASKGNMPFESTGTLSLTPEGMIRVHTTKVKALHLPVKGLMDLLGLDTENLLNTQKISGVSLDKDDLILDAQQVLPPPQLHGHLTSVKIENGEISLSYGAAGNTEPHPALTNRCGARNYLQFKGGAVRFGKLTMADADLVLLDIDPTDPFDFSFRHYKDQIIAGYTKTTKQGGLCVHMPDYKRLKPHANPQR
jgi:hypothetical protein